MALFRRVGNQAADPGFWVPHYIEKPAAEGESKPRRVFTGMKVKIRRVPPGKRLEIERRHRGPRKIRLFRSGDSEITREPEKERAVGLEVAAFALLETEGCVVEVVDDAGAAVYRRLLGDESIQAGEAVTLDGRWTMEVREDFFGLESDNDEFAAWIIARADDHGREELEAEAGKEKTSSTTPSSV